MQDFGNMLNELWVEAAARKPESQIIETPDWFQIITPESPTARFNGIYRSRVNEKDQTEVILKTIRDYSSTRNSFRWMVDSSTNKGLGEKLIEHGFEKSFEAYGLLASSDEMAKISESGFRIERLSLAEVDDWIQASVDGWTNYPIVADELKSEVVANLKNEKASYIYYSGYVGEKLVGTGTMKLCRDCALLFGGTVHPDFRGKGLYRDMIVRRAIEAKKLGHNLLTSHAVSTTSAPILLALGFKHINTLTQYRYTFK